jgi:outer membrane lipoprotein LolB
VNLRSRGACAVLLCALFAGCVSQPPAIEEPPPEAPASLSESERWLLHRDRIGELAAWEARGKVGFTLPDEAGSASLRWRQRDDASDLRLSGPLGANPVSLRSDGALIRLRRDGIERSYPADAAPWLGDGRLLPIPVLSIQHWLRGIPNPQLAVTHIETRDGLLQAMSQDDWEIRYEDYQTVSGYTLPARLTVNAPRVSLQLRVIIRDWGLE